MRGHGTADLAIPETRHYPEPGPIVADVGLKMLPAGHPLTPI